jgi:hypothetical protein
VRKAPVARGDQLQRRRVAAAHAPLVGSSRMTILEPPTKAIASESLRFWPPESVPAGTLVFSVRPTCPIALVTSAATCDGGTPAAKGAGREGWPARR